MKHPMTRRRRLKLAAGLAAGLGLAMGLALIAANRPSAPAWTPDPVQRTQVLKGRSDGSGGEVRCTFYADLLVRESDTDTPSPENALLVRNGRTRPSCSADAPAGVQLDTAGFGLVGRAGPYLLFQESSSNGTVPFSVVDVRTGRTVIDDISDAGIDSPGALRILDTSPGAITLTFRRGFNAECGILADPATCWRAIADDPAAELPAAIARQTPPVQACTRSYQRVGVPGDDPSIISYEVQVSWTAQHGKRVTASGPVDCHPLP